jgi:CIC family chloride channel protein
MTLIWNAIGDRVHSWLEEERPLENAAAAAARATEARCHELLVAISNPETAKGLISLAAGIAHSDDAVVALKVVPVAESASLPAAQRQAQLARRFRDLLQRAVRYGKEAGAEIETVLQVAHDAASGILKAAEDRSGVRLLLLGWPGPAQQGHVGADISGTVLGQATCDVGVFLNRGLSSVQRVLVAVGGGPHARLGLRLAADLLQDGEGELIALRVAVGESADVQVEQRVIKKVIRAELGDRNNQPRVLPRVSRADSVAGGILEEAVQGYDLLIVGVSEEGLLRNWLLGSIPEEVAEHAPCSLLLVRERHQTSVSRLQRFFWQLLGHRRDGRVGREERDACHAG